MFTTKSTPSSRFEKHRRFQKDIQIQMGKPKYRETPMKSKTRHVDGGSGNPRVHEKFVGTTGFVKHREFNKKTYKSKSVSQSRGKHP